MMYSTDYSLSLSLFLCLPLSCPLQFLFMSSYKYFAIVIVYNKHSGKMTFPSFFHSIVARVRVYRDTNHQIGQCCPAAAT